MKQTKKSLEQLVKDRIQEARDKGIVYKVRLVGRFLGKHRRLNKGGNTGDEFTYDQPPLRMESSLGSTSDGDGSMGFSSTKVVYGDRTVFEEGGGNIRTYIPGTWERLLEELWEQAREKSAAWLRQQESLKKREKLAEDREIRERYGL